MISATETRLLIEAVAVTIALLTGGFAGVYAFVRARQRTPDAIDIMQETMGEMSARLRVLEADRIRDHEAFLRVLTRVEVQNRYIVALVAHAQAMTERLRARGENDIPAPPPRPVELDQPVITHNVSSNDNDAAITMVITSLFNLEEMEELTLQLGIKAEDLNGQTLTQKARALVAYMRRRRRIQELINKIDELRPRGER